MAFRVSALPRAPFEEFFTLDDAALAARGAKRLWSRNRLFLVG
jgi:hypothetical protein